MEEYGFSITEEQDDLKDFLGGFRRLASAPADAWIDPRDLDNTHKLRLLQAERARLEQASAYARGVLYGIERLLTHRHGGPCNTDDGIVWFTSAVPFVVEIAEITGRSPYVMGLRWVRRFLPAWDEMSLSIAVGYISIFIDERNDAVTKHNQFGEPIKWLPSMVALRLDLQPTFAEVTRLELRGWQAVDRPSDYALRTRKTDRQRDRRRAQGTRPRSALTKTKVMVEVAGSLGLSLATVKRRKCEPKIAAMIRALSEPNVKHRTDAYTVPQIWLTPPAANDDIVAAVPLSIAAQAAWGAARRRFAATSDLPEHRKTVEAMMTQGMLPAIPSDNDDTTMEAVA